MLYLKRLLANGNFIIYFTAILGGLIVVTGALIGSTMNDRKSRDDLSKEMSNLKTTITEQSESLAKKDAEIQQQAERILRFSGEINKNTLTIQDLASKISNVVDETGEIANLIKEEQREKGSFSLKLPVSDNYAFNLGSNVFTVDRGQLEDIWMPRTQYGVLPIGFQAKGEELYIFGTFYDRDRRIIASVYENRWAVNKGLCFSVNHDQHGLEIIAETGVIVLKVLLDGARLVVEFVTHEIGSMVVVNPRGINTVPRDDSEYDSAIEQLREDTNMVFEHRGGDYLGKRRRQ